LKEDSQLFLLIEKQSDLAEPYIQQTQTQQGELY